MKVRIMAEEYSAPTAVELIDKIKWMHWGVPKGATTEQYIEAQQKTYKAVTEKEMILPDGTTEERAIAMFKAIAGTKYVWDFSENE